MNKRLSKEHNKASVRKLLFPDAFYLLFVFVHRTFFQKSPDKATVCASMQKQYIGSISALSRHFLILVNQCIERLSVTFIVLFPKR